MYKYIVNRLLLMIPTLLGAAVLVFLVMRLVPGDVCEIRFAGTGMYADPEAIKICQDNLGLNDPKIVQFGRFIAGYFTFDLGVSMWTGRSVVDEIGLRFKLSLQIAILATILSVLIAIPLGTISAVKQDTWVDYAVRG
ncbi:MAG: ABC transporter permease, partial [Minwuiales bacterium]|nr:ABC transporter permease [Minwuiales bacterium]